MTNNNMTSYKMALTLFTLGAFVLAVPVSQSAAQGASATTVELSAAQDKDKKKTGNKSVAPKVNRAPTRAVTPRANTVHRAPPNLNTTQHKSKVNVGTKKNVGPKVVGPKVVGPKVVGPKVTGPKAVNTKVGGPKNVKVFTPHGPKSKTVVVKTNLRGYPLHGAGRATIAGRNYSVWRNNYRVRHRNGWYTFVGLSALTVLAIGAYEYYPYAYISAPEPYCDGLTGDGCQLVWREVETIEGDLVPQCVAYCPWQ